MRHVILAVLLLAAVAGGDEWQVLVQDETAGTRVVLVEEYGMRRAVHTGVSAVIIRHGRIWVTTRDETPASYPANTWTMEGAEKCEE